jgi:hypothetical protein
MLWTLFLLWLSPLLLFVPLWLILAFFKLQEGLTDPKVTRAAEIADAIQRKYWGRH